MAYSNKALPPGTVLREWRLEEVLGVGGFGIVYKGRGIYFDELVAIKEYFPSAISDRKDGDTVVPIDSAAEEVHALGLKKFVEEAKLLWNLSTPSRHPNIVSVRSLFEIHGTAYMVMDFEDGMSLSKILKQGQRFNEASLLALLRPIAEGLERAHRVGVLHRDIKPPNILVNEDGRPVLIDFGSARFEAADATSTKVTFHTPPYAAIEQYVKTYAQGPWTDIYALGVVLYECITGQKPPEVLERMHGGLGSPLADGDWPGYSRAFLKAIDAAMIVRPEERPQSISEWLALLSPEAGAAGARASDGEDDDTTRFVTYDTLTRRILPVAPPPPGFERVDDIEVPVPDSVSKAEFQQVGEDADAARQSELVPAGEEAVLDDGLSSAALVEPPAKPAPVSPIATNGSPADPPPPGKPVQSAAAMPSAPSPAAKPVKTSGGGKLPLVLGGVAVLAAGLGGGWYLLNGKSQTAASDAVSPIAGAPQPGATASAVPINLSDSTGFAQTLQALADEARKSGAPADAVNALAATAAQAGQTGQADIPGLAKSASTSFAQALLSDAERRAQRIARQLPWADPRRPNAARSESAERRGVHARLLQSSGALSAAAQSASTAADPSQAMASAQAALSSWRSFVSAQARAAATSPSIVVDQTGLSSGEVAAPASTPAAPVALPSSANQAVSGSKAQQLAGIVSSSREIAQKVIKMGRSARSNPRGSDDEKANYRTLQQNMQSAQGYLTYLNTLTNSMRGAKTDHDADRLIAQGEQTKRYLQLMESRSSAASR
ncbi:protein kinase [Novosphingobium sp. G106]|uniref:serine/threonine protein kinase n=1 Tax=Novosphingobium sp. G106 TaxID=2849500 RepID=UPI001C2CFED9|nr:serine/threonine-protein kinase [Novosphingobium sp. G106]MBV1689291.1 protein kinase [Novosphingobium sp. G106]